MKKLRFFSFVVNQSPWTVILRGIFFSFIRHMTWTSRGYQSASFVGQDLLFCIFVKYLQTQLKFPKIYFLFHSKDLSLLLICVPNCLRLSVFWNFFSEIFFFLILNWKWKIVFIYSIPKWFQLFFKNLFLLFFLFCFID